MNIALVGYGKMGRMIEEVAIAKGHHISARFDIDNNPQGEGLTAANLRGTDVAIEFSTPATVLKNVERLVEHSIPVVVGTTGWSERTAEIRQLVERHQGALVYSPNFSLGVNLFFRIADEVARILAPYDEFDPYLFESHHRMKKDAPSGTALRLAEIVGRSYGERTPAAVSLRVGHIPGTHELGFDSRAETIQIVHTARNREGFASGAVLAAELIHGRQGTFEFADLLFAEGARNNN
ncbi:MAG: 4-hydroxy-tetrahydrodipicolinate reductase [Acidobacteriota bacterium]